MGFRSSFPVGVHITHAFTPSLSHSRIHHALGEHVVNWSIQRHLPTRLSTSRVKSGVVRVSSYVDDNDKDGLAFRIVGVWVWVVW